MRMLRNAYKHRIDDVLIALYKQLVQSSYAYSRHLIDLWVLQQIACISSTRC
jgi:hypothetical protein